jgi:hypothetical protein
MNDLADKIVFVGVRREFDELRRECPNCERFYEAPDFLELAQVLAGARFFCGNQGFMYTLAEAMKTPRLFGTNTRAANNIPTGPHCNEALFSQGFIYWFNFICKEYRTGIVVVKCLGSICSNSPPKLPPCCQINLTDRFRCSTPIDDGVMKRALYVAAGSPQTAAFCHPKGVNSDFAFG